MAFGLRQRSGRLRKHYTTETHVLSGGDWALVSRAMKKSVRAGGHSVYKGGAGQLNTGRHVVCPPETPLANLQVSLLDKLGVGVEHLGNSTGRLAEFTEGIEPLSGV